MIGGMMNKSKEMAEVPPYWAIYFRVPDIHVRAKQRRSEFLDQRFQFRRPLNEQPGFAGERETLPEMLRFFDAHLAPSVGKFLAALGRAPPANYYRSVAAFGAAFMALESESFLLD